ncbi:MAG: hypothetical protein WA459_07475, partial [Stellaceae bacterium]
MTENWRRVRQTTTVEVRLDHGKAAGFGNRGRTPRLFGCEQRRLRSNFVAVRLAETENRLIQSGIWWMSV